MTIQKIQVKPSSVKHKNIRRGTIFDRPDTLTILRFDCNFSSNDIMCCHRLHSHYDRKQNHTIAQNEAPHRTMRQFSLHQIFTNVYKGWVLLPLIKNVPLQVCHDFLPSIQCIWRSSQVNFFSEIRIYIHKKIQFSITEINIEIKKTATAVIKNELKYSRAKTRGITLYMIQ